MKKTLIILASVPIATVTIFTFIIAALAAQSGTLGPANVVALVAGTIAMTVAAGAAMVRLKHEINQPITQSSSPNSEREISLKKERVKYELDIRRKPDVQIEVIETRGPGLGRVTESVKEREEYEHRA